MLGLATSAASLGVCGGFPNIGGVPYFGGP